MKFLRWNGDEAWFIRQGELVKIISIRTRNSSSIKEFSVKSTHPLNEFELREVTDQGPFGFDYEDLGNNQYNVVALTD